MYTLTPILTALGTDLWSAAAPAPKGADFSQETWWISLIKALIIIVVLILYVLLALWAERWGASRPVPVRMCAVRSVCSKPSRTLARWCLKKTSVSRALTP